MSGEANPLDPQDLANEAQRALNLAARAVYEGLADDYDRHLMEDCAYASPDQVACQVAELTDGAVQVVDVGAGTGLVGEALFRNGVEARIAAIDLVDAMLSQYTCPAYTHRIVADAAQDVPLRTASFDVAVAAGMMGHVLDAKRFVREFLRVVKPGGVAVLTYVPNKRGRTEVFDPNAGLLSHDSRQIAATVESLPGTIADQRRFNAYQNGEHWIRQESIAIVRH